MEESFFEGSVSYWSGVDATIDGMLGGLEELDEMDIRCSMVFLSRFFEEKKVSSLDVGAGIGRVSKNLLLKYFEKVSILESDARFVEKAKEDLGSFLEDSFCCRWQQFLLQNQPSADKSYNLIWIQWVLLYGSDDEVVNFLERIKKTLTDSDGLVAIKENVLSSHHPVDHVEVDEDDHSIVRSVEHFRALFGRAKYKIIGESIQKGFPVHLFPVRMFMLRPE